MTASVPLALAGAVELLDRSLAWTRGGLAHVTADRLDDPTPCARWDLGDLLLHMDDGLDAFTEAATGRVALVPTSGVPVPESIRAKACALLGWWCEGPPDVVDVDGLPMPAGLLLGTASLEITVHGWDVHQTLRTGRQLPEELAAELLPLALLTVSAADRPGRFGPVRQVDGDAPASVRLLAHLGRG